MELIGFVLLCIGLFITFGARRIVMGKTKLEEEDKEEMELLASGIVIAIRIVGIVVVVLGFLFLML